MKGGDEGKLLERAGFFYHPGGASELQGRHTLLGGSFHHEKRRFAVSAVPAFRLLPSG
jgi:hypothetical protein